MNILIITWGFLLLIGTPVLYIGYGFVMCAKRAHNEGKSQNAVMKIDTAIAIFFVLLDAVMNIFVLSVIMFDFRYTSILKTININGKSYHVPNLVTGRLNNYCLDNNERKFRRATADFFAAFLDGKDPSGDHISGPNYKFSWLD